jgi:hypothetical protein
MVEIGHLPSCPRSSQAFSTVPACRGRQRVVWPLQWRWYRQGDCAGIRLAAMAPEIEPAVARRSRRCNARRLLLWMAAARQAVPPPRLNHRLTVPAHPRHDLQVVTCAESKTVREFFQSGRMPVRADFILLMNHSPLIAFCQLSGGRRDGTN